MRSFVVFFLIQILSPSWATSGAVSRDDKISVTILYNSKNPQDGPYQDTLFRGAFLGLMEADPDDLLNPTFVDLGVKTVQEALIPISKATVLLSLVTNAELSSISSQLHPNVTIITPRNKPPLPMRQRLLSLQPSPESRIVAMLHRLAAVQVQTVIPILDDASQLEIIDLYKHLSAKGQFGIKFEPEIFVHKDNEHLKKFRSSSNHTTGILLLAANWLPESHHGLWHDHHYFKWFAHAPVQERRSGYDTLFGMYSLQYVGSSMWESALRRNVLRDMGNYSDPSPNVVSALLAFDAATVTVGYAQTGSVPKSKGLSGQVEFDARGYRHGDANFLGISALSPITSKFAMLLQNSSWILEDFVQISSNKVVSSSVATSSVLSTDGLLKVAVDKMKPSNSCVTMDFQAIAHDPFTQQTYEYSFTKNFPHTLIIPNQFGFGLKFRCTTGYALEVQLDIACAPVTSGVSATVHCYDSNPRQRQKRDRNSKRKFPNSFYPYDRDDTNSLMYTVLPATTPVAVDNVTASSESGPTTTEQASTEPAPPPPPPVEEPKLPNLRGILRSVLPFVAACVGAATGCSVCVVVLGRLPLGAVPAACTGPCFVTSFANCGSLLGRTFAETTVVCTELFRQGRLDLETFLVDAEYGAKLGQESRPTLKVYQTLAWPIVAWMKSSERVTSVVAIVAKPWANHMLYMMGRSVRFNWVGFVVHTVGIIGCSTIAQILYFLESTTFRGILVVLILLGVCRRRQIF